MVQQEYVDFLWMYFLVAGHTKFSPDLLFSKIAQSCNWSDVFTTEELKDIISLYADVILDEGEIVCDWRNPIATKYSKLPGIQTLHDFVYSTGEVAQVHKLCYTSSYEQSTSHVLRGRDTENCVFPDTDSHSYFALGNKSSVSVQKTQHLKQMYHDYPN